MAPHVLLSAALLSVNISASAYFIPPVDGACNEEELAFGTSLVQKQAKAIAKTATAGHVVVHDPENNSASPDPDNEDAVVGDDDDLGDDDDVGVCELMLPLWHVASKHLGQNGGSRCEFLEDFYQQSVGQGKPELTNEFEFPPYTLKQIVIWKCASSEIKANLQVAAEKVPGGNSYRGLSFTMVRDPMMHFVSGYSQIQYWADHCPDEDATFKGAKDQMQAALAFVRDVLNTGLDTTCWVNNHVYSMLGPMHKYNAEKSEIGFVGRLEHFEEDWSTVQMLINRSFPPWNPGLASHSQTDSGSGFPPRTAMEDTVNDMSSGAYAAMEELTKGNRQVVLALGCAVLLPDYVCLGYPNPVNQEDCVSAGFASSPVEWQNTISKINSTMCPQIKDFARLN